MISSDPIVAPTFSSLLLERRHHSLALLFLKVNASHHDRGCSFGIRRVARELDRAVVEPVFAQDAAHICQGHFLLEAQLDDRAAREVDAEVEALRAHAENAGQNDAQGEDEPDLRALYNVELMHLSSPRFRQSIPSHRRRQDSCKYSRR